MEQETRQRKPYQGVQCKLIDFGRDSVMFAISWSDQSQCGLTPIGIATLKNIHYQMSLSEEERYSYNRRITRDFIVNGHYEDYPCWGYFILGSGTRFIASAILNTNVIDEACAMNTPLYQSLPDNGEPVVNVCEQYGYYPQGLLNGALYTC